jgi:hypothetical protein
VLPCLGPRGFDVQAFTGGQLDTRGNEVEFMVVGVGMTYPEDVVLILLKARERHLFEAIHDLVFHFRRDGFTRGEAQHTRCVFMLKGQGID